MLSLFEIYDRIENGPTCAEKEFDLRILYPKIKAIIKEYDLKYDPDNVIPQDDTLADNYFKAGLDLAEAVGLFCISTERQLLVSKKELLGAADTRPLSVMLGTGEDARRMQARKISDKIPPFSITGSTGVPLSEEIFIPCCMSYLTNPYPDALCNGVIKSIQGQIPKTNSANEPYYAQTEMRWCREAVARVGRPGLHLLSGQVTVSTNIGFIAITHPDFLRTTDCLSSAVMNELKTDYDRLSKIFHNASYKAFNRSLQDPIIGGIAGGPEGAALVGVASILLGTVVNHATYHTIHPVHRKLLATSCRMGLWVESVVGQAFARNSHLLITGNHFNAAGPGEKMLLQEVAANAITATVSGLHLGPGPASANSKYLDHASGLEGIFMAEVGHAVARSGISRAEANDLVKALLVQYEKRLVDPPIGQTFQEVYDVKSIRPKPAWQNKRDELVLDLSKKGLVI